MSYPDTQMKMTDQTPDIAGMRVLLGPGDTASFPTRLARALAEQGAQCWVVNFIPHHYSAGAGKLGKARLWGARLSRFASKLNEAGGIGRTLADVIKGIGQFIVFLWALLRADAIVFVSSRSLLPGYLDLPVYRLLGKRVIRVFLGTDSRPRYMTGWHHKTTEPGTKTQAAQKLAQRVRRQRGRVRFMSRFASAVVENPLCGHYQQRPFINWFHVGFPHDPAFFETDKEPNDSSTSSTDDGVFQILHCPSNPAVKGTDRIESVIEQLKTEGVPIEYTRITGMPHAEVLRRLRGCDLVIDELYSDSPMAGFASEAVACGKPVIVGGYGWDLLSELLGEHMAPNLLCTPAGLEQAIRDALANPEQARAVGEQAYGFMNSYWHQDQVAKRFAHILTGQAIPESWWIDPKGIDYWQGLGATDEHRIAVIQSLIETCGIDSLGLDPEQTVYRTVISWAEGS